MDFLQKVFAALFKREVIRTSRLSVRKSVQPGCRVFARQPFLGESVISLIPEQLLSAFFNIIRSS